MSGGVARTRGPRTSRDRFEGVEHALSLSSAEGGRMTARFRRGRRGSARARGDAVNGHGREICCPRVAMGRGRLRTFIAILELRLSRGWTGWYHGDEGSARGSSGADPRRGRASASRRLRASRARLKRFRALQRETHPVDERHRVAPILRHEVTSAAEASEHPPSPRTSPARECDAPLELTRPRQPPSSRSRGIRPAG